MNVHVIQIKKLRNNISIGINITYVTVINSFTPFPLETNLCV